MDINRVDRESIEREIEFEEHKILVFIAKFWRFSKFYGKYLGSMHSNTHKQLKQEKRKYNE